LKLREEFRVKFGIVSDLLHDKWENNLKNCLENIEYNKNKCRACSYILCSYESKYGNLHENGFWYQKKCCFSSCDKCKYRQLVRCSYCNGYRPIKPVEQFILMKNKMIEKYNETLLNEYKDNVSFYSNIDDLYILEFEIKTEDNFSFKCGDDGW